MNFLARLAHLGRSPGGIAILAFLCGGVLVLLGTGKVVPGDLLGLDRPKEAPLTLSQLHVALQSELEPRLAPVEAGLKALAAQQRPESRVAVLLAMDDAREKALKAVQLSEAKSSTP